MENFIPRKAKDSCEKHCCEHCFAEIPPRAPFLSFSAGVGVVRYGIESADVGAELDCALRSGGTRGVGCRLVGEALLWLAKVA